MSQAADFIDAALQYEVSPYAYPADGSDGLLHYGTSVGAIRGTIRDALKRYSGMSHDEVTALSSELWAPAVFERRQAAIILLQANADSLVANDLTRIEGFIRSAGSDALVDQLVTEVVGPMLTNIDVDAVPAVQTILRRWASDLDPKVKSAGLHLQNDH